jgi:hypothetical protein
VPRLRPKRAESTRFTAPDNSVVATDDLQYGHRWVPKGTRLERTDPLVVEAPHLFEVRYRLSEEVHNNDG